MLKRFPSLLIPPILICLIISILFSCKTRPNLVLDDPTYFADMLEATLEGKQFRITTDDYPGIRLLLQDEDPNKRKAGILLIEQANDTVFFPELFTVALDDSQIVTETAIQAINKNINKFRKYLLSILNKPNHQRHKGAIHLSALLGNEEFIPVLIQFFVSPDEKVRIQASLAVHALAKRNNKFLQKALNSSEPLMVASAYQTISYYADPKDAAIFIKAFDSPYPKIQKAAQIAMIKQGKGGLPFLHSEAINEEKSLATRLIILNIIQGLRYTESLVTLFNLLRSEDERIRTKVLAILGTYGSEAIPVLEKFYVEGDILYRVNAVHLIGEIRAIEALPILSQALSDSSELVQKEAVASFKAFGSSAWIELRKVLESGDFNSQIHAINLLMLEHDEWLAYRTPGEINREGLFSLITISSVHEITEYLDGIQIDQISRHTILNLKESWNLASEFKKLELDIDSEENSYLHTWRQREIYASEARKNLRQSFSILHQFFENPDVQVLRESSKMRLISRTMETQAQAKKKELKNLPLSSNDQGKIQLLRYKELRRKLVQVWKYTPPEMRELALALYTDRGVNPETLSRESVILE